MRRHAGIAVSLLGLLAGACTRTWVLPGDPDGGAPLADASTDGASGKGGALGFGGRGGANGSGGQPGPGCSATQDEIDVDIVTTDLIFLVDRGMSMGTKVGETTRLGAVQSVVRSVVQLNQYAVNFGYAEFPGTGACPNQCCLPSNVLPTQARNWPAIEMATRPCDFGPGCVAQNDARPIAQTLMAVAGQWSSSQPRNPTVVLLVDGPPGCPFDDPSQTCQPTLDTLSMLSRAAAADVETYVVALGQDAQNDPCLQKMAVRGATQMGLIGVSENGQDLVTPLEAAINDIISAVAVPPCTIELKSKPPRLDLVAIIIDGGEIPFDPSGKNGWNFVKGSNLRIQLRGSSCQILQGARPSQVSARFGCAPCTEASPCHT